MTRGIGGVQVIQNLLPEGAALLAAALTQLGDAWFLSLLLVVLYWALPEEEHDVLLVGALLFVAAGAYRTLKHVFALPRPNDPLLAAEGVPGLLRPLYEATAFATSYGFPSGHATSSAVVYLGLAGVLGIWTRRRRYAVAATVVTVVGLTRVVLGLHYLVDVVAGAALGAAVAWLGIHGVRQFAADRVTVVLAVGVLTSAAYAAASGATRDSLLLSGAVLGLLGGWQLLVLARAAAGSPAVPVSSVRRRRGIAAVAFAPLLVTVATTPVVGVTPIPGAGFAGFVVAGVVLAPTVRRVDEWRQLSGAGRL